MRQSNPLFCKAFKSAASITFAYGLGCILDTNGCAALPASTPENKFLGVAQEAADTRGYLNVQILGVAEMISDGSGAFTQGDYVVFGTGGDGKVTTYTPAVATTTAANHLKSPIGIALNAVAATAGLIVDVLLRPNVASFA